MPDSELQIQTDEVESADAEEVGEALSVKVARFVRTCWVRRRMVFGILVTGILVSVLYAFSLPNMYISTTTLMPPDNASQISDIIGLLSPSGSTAQLGSEALGLSTPGDLFISILKSRNVQDGLINRLNLAHRYHARNIERARSSLEGATKIEQDRASGVLTISITDTDPVTASNIAQGYVEELNRVLTDNSTSAARRERIFLEARVKEVKQSLDDSAQKLSQFSTNSGAIDMPSQTKSMLDEGLRLQAELIDGRSQLAALRQNYSEDNSRVRALEAHNAELQRELDKMGGLTRESGASADANKSLYPPADELPVLGLTYYDLERKVRVEEELWEILTKQYETAKVEEAAEIPAVRVLDAANVPLVKSSPSRSLIVELGAMLSAVFALIAVFVREVWEEMDTVDEPKRLIRDAVGAAANSRWWIWGVPGMRWMHARLKKWDSLGNSLQMPRDTQ